MEYDDFNMREECNKLLKECENRLKITKDEEEIKKNTSHTMSYIRK